MKKVILLILCMVLATSLIGCSKKDDSTNSGNKGNKQATTSQVQDDKNEVQAEWPSKAINMTCPWSVGGIADLAIRAIAEYGEEHFGQPIIPVNRLGAGGSVAITEFMGEKANEPTIIMASEGVFATMPLQNNLAFKWGDFEPVIGVNTSSFVLVTNPKKGIETFEDLIEYGKTNKIIFASSGIGSDNYLLAATLFELAGVEYVTVGYNGSADAMNAVISGDVIVGVTHPALAKENVKAGNLVAVTVFDDKDWVDEVYKVPSVTSFGYDVVLPNLNFFMMPKGTHKEIIDLVHEKIKAIFEEDKFKEVVEKLDLVINPASPEEIEQHIQSSMESAKRFYEIINK